jgi:uncharacterized membrane protein YbhN (UPF0104 family)
MQQADTAFVAWMVVMMVLSYVAGAVSMLGSVTVDLPFLRTTVVMFAQSFLNRFTPANAGGMALRARYLQRNGVDLTIAATAVGLTTAASGICQVVLIVVFFVWAGTSDAFANFTVPNTGTLLLVLVVLVAAFGLVAGSGWGKRTALPWVRKVAHEARAQVHTLARDPLKTIELFGGAAGQKLATIVAFWLSIRAFGQTMSFAEAGALYLLANTAGSAVPTPGGVGGIEAVLTAVLLSRGIDNATAAAIVLLFRFITYWLPTLPGWIALEWVEREGVV